MQDFPFQPSCWFKCASCSKRKYHWAHWGQRARGVAVCKVPTAPDLCRPPAKHKRQRTSNGVLMMSLEQILHGDCTTTAQKVLQ
eukprot:2725593-Amphidinium_carterae.1